MPPLTVTRRRFSHHLLALAPGLAALAITTASLTPAPARAEEITAGSLTIVTPWARATPPGAKTAAGYFTIVNHGNSPDRLTGGSIIAAGKAELHESSHQNGTMMMQAIPAQEIAPGASLTFAPMAKHMMFIDLKQPLVAGQTLDGTLTFEKAGTVAVHFAVAPIGAMAPTTP